MHAVAGSEDESPPRTAAAAEYIRRRRGGTCPRCVQRLQPNHGCMRRPPRRHRTHHATSHHVEHDEVSDPGVVAIIATFIDLIRPDDPRSSTVGRADRELDVGHSLNTVDP